MTKAMIQSGDIVTLPKRRGYFLVIRSGREESEDRMRHEMYGVDVFAVIKFDPTMPSGTVGNPKELSYYFTDGSMSSEGTAIKRDDVVVVGSAKISTRVNVEYAFKAVKMK